MAYTRHRKLGLGLIWGTVICFLLAAILWPLFTLLISDVGVKNVGSAVFGIVGIFASLGALVGIPVGLILAGKREVPLGAPVDERSGKGSASEIPSEIRGWSWGAFVLSGYWIFYFHVWFGLLLLVPIVGLVIWICLALKGRELAWRSQRWESVEEFMARQRPWDKAGKILLLFHILLFLIIFVGGILFFRPIMNMFVPSNMQPVGGQNIGALQPVPTPPIVPEPASVPPLQPEQEPAQIPPSVPEPVPVPTAQGDAPIVNALTLNAWRVVNNSVYSILPSQGGLLGRNTAQIKSLEVGPSEYTYKPELAVDAKKSEKYVVTAYPNDGVFAYEIATKKNYLVWVPPYGDSISEVALALGDPDTFILFNKTRTDGITLNVRTGQMSVSRR